MLHSVTEVTRREQTARSRPGDAEPADPQDSRAAAAQRLGHRSAPDAGVRRRAAGERRLALPRAAQTRTGRLDHRRMARKREQPPREVLFADAPRAETPAERSRALGADRGSDRARADAQGGVRWSVS